MGTDSARVEASAGSGVAAAVLLVVAILLSILAIAVHYPGHVSMDSSMQLYEATLGKSVTWNPPHMTAILRWLGTGPDAAGRLMSLNAVLTYLSLAVSGAALLATRGGERRAVVSRCVAILLILLNPILFLFVGIVWKDIVFSTFMTLGAGCGILACVTDGRRAVLFALASTVVLAIGMKVRQQGIFMAPVLLAVPFVALAVGRGLRRTQVVARGVGLVACFLLSLVLGSHLVARTIETDPKLGNQVGFRGLMQYDVAGITALSKTPSDRFPVPMTDALRTEVRRVYSPDRGDFLWYSPTVTQWLSLPGYDGIRGHWWTLVRAEPRAYLQHRWEVFRAILNADGVKACLPIHVGIDGDHRYLREIGFQPGLDRYDQDIYHFSQKIIRWPIYRHWVYLAAFAVVSGLILASAMRPRVKWASMAIALATLLLYASYLPTSIACDFRYLFPAVCLVSLLWIVYVADARGRPRLGRWYVGTDSSRR
jgi:hypothetical protein